MMNVAKKDFYTNFVAENSMDQGKFFRAAKKLLAKKEVPSFPGYVDKPVLANDIGKFFIRKIESIRLDIDKATNTHPGKWASADFHLCEGQSWLVQV